MNRDFLVDILLSEVLRTSQVDYAYLQDVLNLSPATVIEILQELLQRGTIISNNRSMKISRSHQDNVYLNKLYDLLHVPQAQQIKDTTTLDFIDDALYIPTNFANYFGHKPQGN